MTARQKIKRSELERAHGRPDPQSTRKKSEALLRRITGGTCSFRLVSDEHQAYVQALRRLDDWNVTH